MLCGKRKLPKTSAGEPAKQQQCDRCKRSKKGIGYCLKMGHQPDLTEPDPRKYGSRPLPHGRWPSASRQLSGASARAQESNAGAGKACSRRKQLATSAPLQAAEFALAKADCR